MNTAFQKMEEFGMKHPIIKEDGNYVCVVINHASNQKAEDIIIKFVENHGTINNRQARDLTSIREAEKITTVFGKLREQKILSKIDAKSASDIVWQIA